MLKKLFDNIGFTKDESRVVLLIVGVVLVGFLIRYFPDILGNAGKESYGFRKTDERFLEKSKKMINLNLDSLNEDSDTAVFNQKVRMLQQSEDSLKLVEKEKKDKGKKEYALTGKKINLNTATKEQLMSLPGVGEKTAEKILSYKTENKSFKKIEDIMGVSGIGEKKFEKMKEYLTVE